MIQVIGILTGKETKANHITDHVIGGFNALKKDSKKRVAYFIWYKPWMSVGSDTFIHSMMKTIGWENVFADKTRYPEISAEGLKAADPEVVLLSSEPYPFKEKHIAEIKELLPDAEVLLVDGEMFSWYGSRMMKAPAYMQELINKLP